MERALHFLEASPGYIQPSPWLGIANKQLELMAKYMAELGLSPVSRSRVEARPPHQRSKFAGLIGRPEDDDQDYLFTRSRS